MGALTFGIPRDLAEALVLAGNLKSAVESGTYLGDSARFLASIVPDVWTIEVLPEIHVEAVRRLHDLDGIRALLGPSEKVLAEVVPELTSPTLYWLDGHGGTFGGNDVPEGVRECPVLDELKAIDRSPWASDSCILIDDARAFLSPLLHHKEDQWPSFIEVADLLRLNHDRYVTLLDDVIIAVPTSLRGVVDEWWRRKLRQRDNLDGPVYEMHRALNPSPRMATKLLLKSISPSFVRTRIQQRRTKQLNNRRHTRSTPI